MTKVMTRDSGTARATSSVVRNFLRKRNMKTIARPPPMRPLRPQLGQPLAHLDRGVVEVAELEALALGRLPDRFQLLLDPAHDLQQIGV